MEKVGVQIDNKSILITGVAGFIGSYLAQRLLSDSVNALIVGVDSLTDYNPYNLKKYRLEKIKKVANASASKWIFIKMSISDKKSVEDLFKKYKFDIVVNLAAQAGVRYSISNPDAYMGSNVIGFYNILEACRDSQNLEHLVYASSSSVYGGNKKVPFSTEDFVDNPYSFYAATKKSNELFAFSYSKLYGVPTTGLRFFTVYGPAGRTDMAYFSFAERLREHKKIDVFNYGNCQRDFTYIDDIIEGIYRVIKKAPRKSVGDDGLIVAPYSIYNIGGEQPENLMDFITILSEELIKVNVLEKEFDIKKYMNLIPMQLGDVPVTYADCKELVRDFDYKPETKLRDGLKKFSEWYSEWIIQKEIYEGL